MKYGFGRGNWAESIIVGIVGGVLFILASPLMILAGFVVFIAGITGFLKREE